MSYYATDAFGVPIEQPYEDAFEAPKEKLGNSMFFDDIYEVTISYNGLGSEKLTGVSSWSFLDSFIQFNTCTGDIHMVALKDVTYIHFALKSIH